MPSHKMTYQEQLCDKQKVIIKDVSQNNKTKPKGFRVASTCYQ